MLVVCYLNLNHFFVLFVCFFFVCANINVTLDSRLVLPVGRTFFCHSCLNESVCLLVNINEVTFITTVNVASDSLESSQPIRTTHTSMPNFITGRVI